MAVSTADILRFLSSYGYLVILPLSVIEGPIVTVLAGILSAGSHLDWRWVLALVILGDLIGDLIYYALGRWSRVPAAALGRNYGLTETRTADLERRLNQNATRVLLIGKWTHAIGVFVLIAAGMARLPLFQFLLVNLIATLPKSLAFLLLGYFAGQYLTTISDALLYAPLLLLPVGAVTIVLFVKRARSAVGRAKP